MIELRVHTLPKALPERTLRILFARQSSLFSMRTAYTAQKASVGRTGGVSQGDVHGTIPVIAPGMQPCHVIVHRDQLVGGQLNRAAAGVSADT
jgi:hypothetical protein